MMLKKRSWLQQKPVGGQRAQIVPKCLKTAQKKQTVASCWWL